MPVPSRGPISVALDIITANHALLTRRADDFVEFANRASDVDGRSDSPPVITFRERLSSALESVSQGSRLLNSTTQQNTSALVMAAEDLMAADANAQRVATTFNDAVDAAAHGDRLLADYQRAKNESVSDAEKPATDLRVLTNLEKLMGVEKAKAAIDEQVVNPSGGSAACEGSALVPAPDASASAVSEPGGGAGNVPHL